LTIGAGWGGAIVALTTKNQANRLINALKKEYYEVKFPQIEEPKLKKAVFATLPGSGASVYVVHDDGIQ
jgi:galactokinase